MKIAIRCIHKLRVLGNIASAAGIGRGAAMVEYSRPRIVPIGGWVVVFE
jgi:hypothetical protein